MVITSKNPKKQTKGRQKIPIEPIQDKSKLQVTFSKRRTGLVNKASELSLLCGAQVAILAFSPGKKVFCFGHPSAEELVGRYLGENLSPRKEKSQECASEFHAQVRQWNEEYEVALKELGEERKRVAMVKKEDVGSVGFWWDGPIDEMGLEELEAYSRALKELKKNVSSRVDELMMVGNNDDFGNPSNDVATVDEFNSEHFNF